MENPFLYLEERLIKIESLLEQSLKYQAENHIAHPPKDRVMNITEASEFLNLKKASLYIKTSRNEVPFSKQGNKLYFLESELVDYIKKGKRKSIAEIDQEVNQYLSNKKGGLK